MGEVLLTGGRTLNGLLAGVYLAFVVAVMPTLGGLPDDTFVRVMTRTNEVIVNPRREPATSALPEGWQGAQEIEVEGVRLQDGRVEAAGFAFGIFERDR